VTRRAKAWVKGAAQYGIGFGLLGYILWANWNPRGTNPGISGLLGQTPDWAFAAALVGLAVGATLLTYLRWYVLVRALDLPFTLRDAARLGLVGTFYNAFLPGSIGGDLVKAYFIARDQPARRAAAVATVVADRLVGLFGFLWVVALVGGAMWWAGVPGVADSRFLHGLIRGCGAAVGVGVAGWVLVGLLPARRADRFAGRLGRLPKVGKTLAEVWYTVWTYRRRPGVVAGVLALTAVIHAGMILTVYAAARVFPAPDPATLAETIVIAPVGLSLQAFIPLPGGVGGAEAVFGLLYTQLGRPDQTGVIGRFTQRVVEWGIGFVGYLTYLRMRAELPPVEAEAEEEGYGGHEEPHVEPEPEPVG
jgi:uncharacterized membrane protein YbhN (UPF0104 family)